ncbi:MAG: hydrogenase maturation nickel metallochaperone HypA [Lachnospiraceae bacterium]|nr:hydrogenase maturation nickel metallochaperone HypA [Lachnospiraceae bacterium]
MHELGVVKHVIKTLEEVADENSVTKIGSVTLSIGEVSGIIHEQIKDCWDYFKKKSPLLEEAELKIDEIPAVTYCTACEGRYETVKYGKICPYCKSPETYLLQGNEFTIKEIEAE